MTSRSLQVVGSNFRETVLIIRDLASGESGSASGGALQPADGQYDRSEISSPGEGAPPTDGTFCSRPSRTSGRARPSRAGPFGRGPKVG